MLGGTLTVKEGIFEPQGPDRLLLLQLLLHHLVAVVREVLVSIDGVSAAPRVTHWRIPQRRIALEGAPASKARPVGGRQRLRGQYGWCGAAVDWRRERQRALLAQRQGGEIMCLYVARRFTEGLPRTWNYITVSSSVVIWVVIIIGW